MSIVKNIEFLFILFFFSVVFNLTAQENINQFDANGNRTGYWEKKFNNGKVRYRGQFIGGKETGFFYFYTEFNQSRPYLIKEFKNGGSLAKLQFFNIDGLLESEGNMNGRDRIGKWLYYASDGRTIVLEENYVKGKLSGVLKIFYKDGTLTEISHYKNGKLNGNSKRYTSEGKMITDINYVDDVIHGKVIYYDNKGVIRETGFYDYGKRVGRWEFYVDGVLAGVDEPNKKKEREPISLEELERRKKKKKKR